MNKDTQTGRRTVLKAGLAAVTAAAVIPGAQAELKPKAPGETRVVAVMGDYWHNPVSQEVQLRDIFSPNTGWRIMFVQSNRFFTPELISDADLMVVSRSSEPEPIDWRPDGLVDSAQKGGIFWTDDNVTAIIDNIRNRGMGLLALHCASYARNRAVFNLLGVEPIMHNQVQPLWVHDANQEHPITKGIGKFFISLDEQFAAVIKSHYTTTLFTTTAIHDKREAVGGWCLENGNGRIVGLLPGHTPAPYDVPEYRKILWRSAFWAMKGDIPPYRE